MLSNIVVGKEKPSGESEKNFGAGQFLDRRRGGSLPSCGARPAKERAKEHTSETSSPVVRTKLLFNNHGPINNPTFVILKKTMLDEIFLLKCLK